MTDSIPLIRSANAQARGNLVHVWGYDPTGIEHVAEGLLTPEEALDFAQRLIQAAALAIANQRSNLARGDCSTCKNTRMVKNERDMREHCPDCSAKIQQAIRDRSRGQ